MKCTDPEGCPCLHHVSPETHVPTCPWCATVLTPADPDPTMGDCPNRSRCPGRGRVLRNDEWTWLPKDTFDGADLPPANGYYPITIREEWL
jgi:hypothetical protein